MCCVESFSAQKKTRRHVVGWRRRTRWREMMLYSDPPVDLLEALRLISVTMSRETWVVNCSRSENFSVMVLGGAFPKTCSTANTLIIV